MSANGPKTANTPGNFDKIISILVFLNFSLANKFLHSYITLVL
jgi:hypothetical protein